MTFVIGHHEVEQFRALLVERLGLYFDDARLGVLADALRRHVEASGADGDAYLKRLATADCPPEELRTLARDLTVTETYFYRNADQIRAFVEVAVPACLTARANGVPLRVLSAGCASGDEPYSLAIALREHATGVAEDVSIVAVDVNPAMLEKAHRGSYSNWSLRELPDALRTRWFHASGGGFELDASIRGAVAFEERNLVHDDAELWRPGSWDVVLCRNVLMYFDPVLAQTVVTRIARALVPGGFLFLGHAETLRGLSSDFHLCHTHETFYYRRKEGEVTVLSDATTRERRPEMWLASVRVEDDSATWIDTVQRASERIRALADVSQELSVTPSPAAVARSATDLHRALELLRRERFDQALAQLDALPAEQAREPEALLLRAVSAVHGGALAQAEAVCGELLLRDELNAGAHHVLALCRESRGDVPGAVEQDQVAVYLDPGFSMARLHLGLLARRRGERETARRELAQALVSLQQEDASRLLLFGGGFSRDALVALCRAELAACGDAS